MTVHTCKIGMFAGQWKQGPGMIERNILPGGGFMARSAFRSQFAIVPVILLMAGETVPWRALEYSIFMAVCTSHIDVET